MIRYLINMDNQSILEPSEGNILIVDDEPAAIRFLLDVLKKKGYQLRIALNAKAAIDTIKNKLPDLILLDINLPDMNGFDVCQQLKASEHYQEIPVIFLSGQNDTVDKVKAFQVGGIDYITKPFSLEEVLARVKTHIMVSLIQKKLEERVTERTINLKNTNKQLQEEINERKKAEQELREAKKAAESANRAKSEFLANMSHEIRTPLNAVIGFSDLLSKMVTDKKQKSYLSSIQTAGKTLLTLINDILDLAKIEAGRLDIQLEAIDPKIIFAELEQLFTLKMAEKGLEFRIEMDEMLPPALELDENRLRQVLLNLISNAVKFTEQGYIKLSARQCHKENDAVDLILAVEDTGIGIPFDSQENIFQAFQQQDGQSTRKYGGTGLGLAITKRLVSMMNGHISLKSQVDKGSIFEITLRNVKVSDVVPAVKKDNNVSTIFFDPAKILVVDDIESNRDVIKESLSQVNLEIIEADEGQKGLLFAQEYKPDLILMDIRMPVMDGYEATKQLKKNPSTQNIPVIALTASVLDEPSKLEAHDFDGCLFKPVQISKLMSELSYYLKHTNQPVKPLTETVDSLNNLTPFERKKLPSLMEKLDQLIPKWKNFSGALDLEKIEQFAAELKRLGDEYHISYMTHYTISRPLIAGVSVVTVVLFVWVINMLIKMRSRSLQSGREEMLGVEGECLENEGGRLRVYVHSETWNAVAPTNIAPGQRVRITGMDGLVLKVEAV